MKVNDLSEKIVTSTGRIIPGWFWVRELNSFTNAMMLIPCGPSAVPTGGAGVACPAGICNFTNPVTFFAIQPPFRPLVSHSFFSVAVVDDVPQTLRDS